MATTNFKGQPVKLIGEFIQDGKVAPDFELVKSDLSSFALKDLKGKNIVLNIFPSLDTGVCATSVRKFNKMAAGMKDTVVLAISKDLPFAQGRFCTTEGIEKRKSDKESFATGTTGCFSIDRNPCCWASLTAAGTSVFSSLSNNMLEYAII